MTYTHPAARLLRPLLAFAFTLTATLAPGPAPAADPAAQRKPLPAVEGEVIVAFKADAGTLRKHALSARANADAVSTTLADRASTLGARIGRTLQTGAAVGERVQVMRSAGVDATTLARQLAADPDVAYAVPNGRKRIVTAPNDPLYPATAAGQRLNGPDSGQWYLRAPNGTTQSAIDIETAWLRTTGSSSVVVAVLDTGVRFDHPDLGRAASGGPLLPGYDMVTDPDVGNDGDGRDADPSDPGDWTSATENSTPGGKFYKCDPAGTGSAVASGSSWHGTSTASLVAAAANNATGMAGAAPGTRVLPVRVLGKCFGSDSDILAGMRWAAGLSVSGVPDNPNPARVINLSLGGTGVCSAAYQAAVDEITARGVLIVAAAGNSAGGPVSEPANCRGVVGVLALRHAGTKVGFSDLGAQIGLAAPGGNCINTARGSPCLYPILAATNTGSQGPVASSWTNGSSDITVGTSFSSPLVAAVAGLVFSQNPALTPAKARAALQAAARPFPSTGADNGADDATTVPSCTRLDLTGPSGQCYCPNDGTLCGAGMLDAGASVNAVVTGVVAKLSVLTASPAAGTAVLLRNVSVPIVDDRIVGQAWTLVSGGGIVTQFDGGLSTGPDASFTPTAAGTVRVRLTATGDRGGQATVEQSIAVGPAAAVTPPTAGSAGGGSGGGGGGAASWAWVASVGLAAALLQALRRPARPGRPALKASRRRA